MTASSIAVPQRSLLERQQVIDETTSQVNACRERGLPLSLMLFDLRSEKDGALDGGALAKVAQTIRGHADAGAVGVLEGNRIAYLAPEMSGEDCMTLTRAICGQVDALFPDLAIAGGVSTFPLHARTAGELFRTAGEALERAGYLGRGNCCASQLRIIICGDDPALVETRASLLARSDFMVIDGEPPNLIEIIDRQRPNLVVLGTSLGRRFFRNLGDALLAPGLEQTRVIVVTPQNPDPQFRSSVALVADAYVIASGTALNSRLLDAIAEALGARVRGAQRVQVNRNACVVLPGGETHECKLGDLSQSGARITVDTKNPLSRGDALFLEFEAPDGKLRVPAAVVRKPRARGDIVELGLVFEQLEGEQVTRLTSMLRSLGITEAGDAPKVKAARRETLGVAAVRPALELQGVGRSFGAYEALSNVTFSIRPGERVAIIGRSGAGKSTLLRLLNSSVSPSQGRIRLLGEDPESLSERRLRALRARIGTVYQALLLIPQVSVFHNIIAGRLGKQSLLASAAALVSRRTAEQVAAVVEQVGLSHKLYERVDRLSGGEQQRVAVARSLYQDPEILLADEPLASLDPARAAEVVDLFLDAAKNRTLVLSTHQLEPVLPYVSRVIALRGGRVFFDKPRSEVSIDDISRVYESERTNRTAMRNPYQPASKPVRGELIIAACRTAGEYILPDITAVFCRDYPGRKIQVVIRESQAVVQELLEGRAHLGFIGTHIADSQLHTEMFTEDEIVTVASPGFTGLPPEPLPPSLVARLKRIDQPHGAATRQIVEDYFNNIGAPLDPAACALEASSFTATKSAVALGVGIAFMSRMAAQPEIDSGLLRTIKVDSVKMTRRIFLAWRGTESLSLTAKSFVQLARRVWAERGGVGPG